MKTSAIQFNRLVESIYNLPLEEKVELKNILEHNISESRRDEIVSNYKQTLKEEKENKLSFSSDIEELKRKL